MKTKPSITHWLALAALAVFNLQPPTCFAQGTAFTYQGQLQNNGSPANGLYDFEFGLFNEPSGGSQVGSTVTEPAVGVTNGLFTTTIDFGAVFAGNPTWLAISVRSNGVGSYIGLNPLQPLTPTPYAITAGSANNLAGLWVQPNANGAPNLIGGSPNNFVASGVVGATIGGGGATNYSGNGYSNSVTGNFGGVGGGLDNTAGANYATVGGGYGNSASGNSATVDGGYGNKASSAFATAGGGFNNAASGQNATVGGGSGNNASGTNATVGGGTINQATNTAATVPGGGNNVAGGQYSFAAGYYAQATNNGAFVWADAQGTPFGSTTTNQFNVRANGGVRFVTGGAGLTVDGPLSGNGSGLTNLNASQLTSGTIPLAQLPAAVITNGAPGTTVWQVPSGTAVQAQSNMGYLLTNSQSVTVTLPGSPTVGGVVEVFGSGLGGWTIAQNAAQSVLYNFTPPPAAWVQTIAPTESWSCIASSAGGSKLAATVGSLVLNPGGIYTSTNSGANWSLMTNAPTETWRGIASSADGSKLAAGVVGGGIYTSTNFGVNWNLMTNAPHNSDSYWYSIVSSSDGSKLAAVEYGGGIYTSTNSGANWTSTSASTENWECIASSADGSKLAAAVYGGGIYTSSNFGASWSLTIAPSTNWYYIASSADGSQLAAVVYGGGIYTSANFGANWSLTSAPSEYWTSLASSADGSKLAAVSGGIYTSSNFGASWSLTSAPSGGWSSIAFSADGSKLAAAVGEGYAQGGIWTSGYSYSAVTTTTGTAGLLGGGAGSGVKLVYAGGGQFVLVNQQGNIYGQ